MADPSFLTMQQRVKRATKVDSAEPDVSNFIKDSINQAYYDVVRQNEFPEFLRTNTTVVIAGSIPTTGTAALLPEFLKEERVRFYDVSATRLHQLVNIKDAAPPAPLYGLPTKYHLIFGGLSDPYITIMVEPVALVQFGIDQLFIEYYRAPALLVADGDLLTSYRMYEEIIKRAVVNVYNYKGRIDQAKIVWSQTFLAMDRQSEEQREQISK